MHYILILFIVIYLLIYIIINKKLNKLFLKYSNLEISSRILTQDISRLMLEKHEIKNISINNIKGNLNDHYNVQTKEINLSNEVYNKSSLSSIAVTIHESGHAIQDNNNYILLKIKKSTLPLFNLLNILGLLFIFIGILISKMFFQIGLLMLAIVFLFQLLTLPIETNASSRGINFLIEQNICTNEEIKIIKEILNLSAFGYIFSMFNYLCNILFLFKNTLNKSKLSIW